MTSYSRSNIRTLAALILTVAAGYASNVHAQPSSGWRTVEGKPFIVDGDTLEVGVHRVHLFGVDAPEPDQHCDRAGRPWRCGMEATYALAALIETNWVTCRERATDTNGDMVATCRMGGPKGVSVNEELVRRGWALPVRPMGDAYIAAEQQAKTAKLGLWSGSFAAPWEWRRTRQAGETGN